MEEGAGDGRDVAATGGDVGRLVALLDVGCGTSVGEGVGIEVGATDGGGLGRGDGATVGGATGDASWTVWSLHTAKRSTVVSSPSE